MPGTTMEEEQPNLYAVLGVEKGADEKEVSANDLGH